MSRWFRSATTAKAPAMVAEEEDEHLQQVEHALLQLLNDDIAEADRILKQHNSAYHHLGRGISSFIASMLGVEKELLKDAANTLHIAENKTWEDMKKAQASPTAYKSSIYPPGTEYLLCYAISQLTSAVCAVLSGSVTEAIKGFYKLRKAYLTLNGIMEIESNYLKKRTGSRDGSLVAPSVPSGNLSGPAFTNISPSNSHEQQPNEKTSLEIPNSLDEVNRNEPLGLERDVDNLSLQPTRVESKLLDIDPASVGITSHTDIFIHSGTRLTFGLLILIFGMVDNPMFNRILYIVGFKGDRERGTRYLWQAARFNNFNSAIAGISLLAYYNGLVGFCDILPTDSGADDDLAGWPRARCKILLTDMRKRYPDSRLWKMEEARMHAYNRNLAAAVKILSENSDSNMKQIAVINMFELSLTTMFIHDYALCARSWIQCAELSTWSPTLYAYLTGIAYVELYRNARESDPTSATKYKEKATEYIRKGPPLSGRQKVMSRELPFDTYIVRKVAKWEERVKSWKVDLVDAIGVSPLAEMTLHWGGLKKQDNALLEKTLSTLSWERVSHGDKFKGDLDETAIHAIINATTLRNLGRRDEAREFLNGQILNHDRSEFKGHLKDDWTCPNAHYEMACLAWREKDLEGADHNAKVNECYEWLEKTQKWGEEYVLNSRMAVKVGTALNTVKRHRKIMGM